MAGSYYNVCLIFKEITKLFNKVVSFTFLPVVCESLSCYVGKGIV